MVFSRSIPLASIIVNTSSLKFESGSVSVTGALALSSSSISFIHLWFIICIMVYLFATSRTSMWRMRCSHSKDESKCFRQLRQKSILNTPGQISGGRVRHYNKLALQNFTRLPSISWIPSTETYSCLKTAFISPILAKTTCFQPVTCKTKFELHAFVCAFLSFLLSLFYFSCCCCCCLVVVFYPRLCQFSWLYSKLHDFGLDYSWLAAIDRFHVTSPPSKS